MKKKYILDTIKIEKEYGSLYRFAKEKNIIINMVYNLQRTDKNTGFKVMEKNKLYPKIKDYLVEVEK